MSGRGTQPAWPAPAHHELTDGNGKPISPIGVRKMVPQLSQTAGKALYEIGLPTGGNATREAHLVSSECARKWAADTSTAL